MNLRTLRLAMLATAALLLAACIPDLVADAGPDQAVNEGASVTVRAGANVLEHIVNYKWVQTAGPKVKFKVSRQGVLTFTAPGTEVQQKLTFELTVMYERGYRSKSDSVDITVNQIKFFGTAAGSAQDYAVLLNWFDQITPENAGKWGSVEATRDVMNWQPLDDAYNFAKLNHLPFKFHTLIWGQQQPAWMTGLPADQQLAEIEQWMAAVAARYPDIDLIDVVNEPLNNPAGYREALGGAGATGYDWVIKSFQMARAHFPHARLLINEFNTVILGQFTDDYLTVIKLLQDRKLLDGIGEQGHFLERADVAEVKANLDKLGATGLPIYISELDLNFADDARQANVMRDLFKVFWDHPSVGGITHWGFRQGAVWQPNSHLVRSDGTTRPALDWITCYIGGGGDSCTVPPYVPAGWKGGEFGLTFEAEQYDAGQGALALGSVVAYTDDGDWIAFKNVELQPGWNTFWATYAKGNTDPGSISVHLDSLDAAPLFTLDLPPTGSWGTSTTVEQDWPPLSGTHDVYIRFNGASGVANLDNVRIGKPQPQSGVNLVTDGGFETGMAGWSAWNGATLAASNAQAHSGSQSLHATNRPNDAQFAVYSLNGKVQTDTTYAVSAWVLINGAGNGTVRLASKVACAGLADTYPWLQNDTAVVPGTWTQLAGNLTIPAGCTPTDVAIFFEGTDPAYDVFVDDVKVVPPGSDLVTDGGFESGAAGWSAWNGATLATSNAQAHTGSLSLHATNRPDANQFAVYSLMGKAQTNTTYSVSAWVLIDGCGNGTVRLASKLACAGASDTYPWLENNEAVVPGTWTRLAGNLVVPSSCTPTDVAIFFEGTDPAYDVYLDDVSVTPL
jgi:GH35 family endo-1,4-beta-xylanase